MNSTPSRVIEALQGLEKNLFKANKHLSLSEEEALGRVPNDPAGGKSYEPGLKDKFKSALFRLQTARKFRRWELEIFGDSAVDMQLRHPTSPVKHENWARYLQNTGQYKNTEETASRRCTMRHGCQLLVLEAMMGTTGICAILAFNLTSLRALQPREILDFKNELLQNPRYSEIVKLAAEKNGWMQRCENLYEEDEKSTQGQDDKVGMSLSEQLYPVESTANSIASNGSTGARREDDVANEGMYTSEFANSVEILGDIEEALGVADYEWPDTDLGDHEEDEGAQAAWLLSELDHANVADYTDSYMTDGPGFFGSSYFEN